MKSSIVLAFHRFEASDHGWSSVVESWLYDRDDTTNAVGTPLIYAMNMDEGKVRAVWRKAVGMAIVTPIIYVGETITFKSCRGTGVTVLLILRLRGDISCTEPTPSVGQVRTTLLCMSSVNLHEACF